MILKNKYVFGCHVMFYEIEMLPEYLMSIQLAASNILNKENITCHIDFNVQTYLECVDTEQISISEIHNKLNDACRTYMEDGVNLVVNLIDMSMPFYNIAQHRRDMNSKYCEVVDYVVWGETDSMFPAEYFYVMEGASEFAKSNKLNRYIVSFADRKNWDSSWDVITHPMFENETYIDTPEWIINNIASSKSYMTYDQMCEINALATEYDLRILNEPKFDGSCLTISSQLILSGANIPIGITHCGEDTSFGVIAKRILGNSYCQFLIKNILRVHNRRHPKKRMYIQDEENPMGFVGKQKGDWWDILENTSKHNLGILCDSQDRLITIDEVLLNINNSKKS